MDTAEEKPITFTDVDGKTWKLELDLEKLHQIDQTLGLNLGTLEGQIVAGEQLFNDYLKLRQFLWILCEPQADASEPPIDPKEFGSRITGNVVAQIIPEVVRLLADFTPPENRSIVSTVKKQKAEFVGAGLEQVEELVAGPIKDEFLAKQRESTLKRTREQLDSAFGD